MRVFFLVRGFGVFLALMMAFAAFWVVYLTAAAVAVVALCVALIVAIAYTPRAILNYRRIRYIRREHARQAYRESIVEEEPTQGLDPEMYEPGVSSAHVRNREGGRHG